MLPKLKLTDPVLLDFRDGRSDFVDQLYVKLCQYQKKKKKKKNEKKK